MSKRLEQIGLPDPAWDYHSVWTQIIRISDEVDEVGLLVSSKEEADEKTDEAIVCYLRAIVSKSKEVISLLEYKKEKMTTAEKLISTI